MAERQFNIEGVPFDEIFTSEETYRLGFIQWLIEHELIDHSIDPQTPLTDIIPHIHIIDQANKGSIGEFFNRHRRRGPQRKPGDPGYQEGI
ncbi:MAG: hypothetical protein C5B43_04140 [Verrucomicrobia bacterium]|nr:MAG: hypothetical protein C5B43_04140 [Verrucomicrobiota bacterium]